MTTKTETPKPKTISDASDAFHDHLDVCTQCRDHPFNLCPIGHRLINEAAHVIGDAARKVVL